jgi:HTH DNA binding domain
LVWSQLAELQTLPIPTTDFLYLRFIGNYLFKCDVHGLAIVCRIQLKDKNTTVKDLVGKGLLTNIEILYKEKDGSLVVFIEGKSCVPRPPKNVSLPKLLMAHPPEFLDINRMKAEVIGKEEEISKFLQHARKWGTLYKILGLTSLETKSESLLSRLTSKQKNALLSAYALGYYDIPRRISSDDVSRHLKVDKSTVVEHLRRAEKKLIADIISG